MKKLFTLVLALLFSSILWGKPGDAAEKPKPGGTLALGIQRDLILMNPLIEVRSTEQHIRELMFEALLDLDAKGKIVPKLAESWEISPDGKVYTFKLRRGVKFHNGQEMTAGDVKFAIDYTINPKNAAFGRRQLSAVSRVETPDKHTLRIFLTTPSPAFLASLTTIESFSVIPKESIPEGIEKITTYPPGTGPFKFAEWKPRQYIGFERFDDYWGGKAYVDKLTLRPIRDETVRFTAVRTGEVDMVERVPYEWVKQVKDGRISGVRLVEGAEASWRKILFNVADPPFNNKKLRQAVAHAINKKEILQAAYFGFGEPVNQKYIEGHEWHVEGLPPYARDLEKARKLLKEAGYGGGTIKIQVEQSQVRETEATILQAQLKKIGMNIELEVMERGAFTSRLREGKFDFVTYGGDTSADPLAVYASDHACIKDLKKRTGNLAGYCDREFDKMLEQFATELDAAKRKEIYKRIVAKIHEDLPEIALGFVPRFFALQQHVKGFTTDGEARFMWSGGGLHRTWIDK